MAITQMVVVNGVRYRADAARRLGLIADGKVVTARSKAVTTAPEVVETNTAAPADAGVVPDAPAADAEAPDTDAEQAEVQRPHRGASKALWIEYALAQGVQETELEGLSRDEIADLFT